MERDVLNITTGMQRSVTSALTSANTARPSFFGKLRSSITRSGRGACGYGPK
jgi:hypothetical protein